MRRRTHQGIALASFLLLVACHLDFWRPQRDVLWFGWLPEELAWRLAWMLAAGVFVVYFTRCVWRDARAAEDGEAR